MNSRPFKATALAVALGAGTMANAAIVGSTDTGVFDAGSSPGALRIDVDLDNHLPRSAAVTAEAASETFDSVLRNIGILGDWLGVRVTLDGATFDTAVLGATTVDGGLPGARIASLTANSLLVSFASANPLLAELGDPLLAGGANFAILANVGDRYTVTFSAVPEPGTIALLGLGALALGALRRRTL